MRSRFHKTSPPEKNPLGVIETRDLDRELDPDDEWFNVRPEIRADLEAAAEFGRQCRARERKRAVWHGLGMAVYVVAYVVVQTFLVAAVVVFGGLAASGVSHQSKWD